MRGEGGRVWSLLFEMGTKCKTIINPPRYPHSLATWVRISVLKTRNKGCFEQRLNVSEFGKKGVFL